MISSGEHGRTARRGVSLRAKITFAFSAMCIILAAVGYYAVAAMSEAGRLVVDTYDKPLMQISFARAVHADFAAMEAALMRRLVAPRPQWVAIDAMIDDRAKDLKDDLDIVTRRSTSERTRKSVEQIKNGVEAWMAVRRQVQAQGITQSEFTAIDKASDGVREQIDLLVNYAAGDGFLHRQKTLGAIDMNRSVQIGGVVAALLLSLGITVALVRQIMGPLGEASRAANRIARGELSVDIPISGRDEMASLLQSMTEMRDSIRAMVETERTLRRSAQVRLSDALENSSEGIIVADARGRVVVANAMAQQLFGPMGGEDAHDGDFHAQLHDAIDRGVFAGDTRAERLELVQRLITDAKEYVLEERLADGRWVRIVQGHTSDGGFVVIISDISLLKERELILRDARDRAEAANRAKSEFLANMGHELRTPLNAVIGFSEIIASEAFGPVGNAKYREFATDIQRSGHHLLAILNDILDLAKSETGQLEFNAAEVCVRELLDDCERMTREQFTRAAVKLDIAPAPKNLNVAGDAAKLRQILLNLLSNAAKFTQPGGSTTVTARLDGAGKLVIAVADTGIGMKPEQIPLALAPFSQVDGRLERKYEGTGLGLALTKVLVELHQGELRVDSAPGRGTTVSVVLPRAAATHGADAALSA